MHLKKDIKLVDFLYQINHCKNDVFFSTNEGDMLNLKSTLSQLVFASISDRPEVLYTSNVLFKSNSDYELLKEYLTN